MTLLRQQPTEKRKRTRELLQRLDNNRHSQIELIENNLIKPLKEGRVIIKKILMNEEDIEKLVYQSEQVNKLLMGILKWA